MLIFVFRWLTYRRYLVTQQAADLHDMPAGCGATRYAQQATGLRDIISTTQKNPTPNSCESGVE
jgi:hypothetical protein